MPIKILQRQQQHNRNIKICLLRPSKYELSDDFWALCCTDGSVSSHVVAVVETDKGQVGYVRGKGQDEQHSHHAGHSRTPQTQSSVNNKERDSVNRCNPITESVITLHIFWHLFHKYHIFIQEIMSRNINQGQWLLEINMIFCLTGLWNKCSSAYLTQHR